MCGRYAIILPPEAIRQIFQTHGELPNWPAYYNAAPTTALPVVRQAKAATDKAFSGLQETLTGLFASAAPLKRSKPPRRRS